MEKRKVIDYRKILGDPQTRESIMERIQANEDAYQKFLDLTEELQEEIIAFAMGNWGLKITYDPIFKYIFNPTLHPERLSEFLSLVLNEEVAVIAVLPNESDRISDKGSLLIMDILVKLKSGALANIEIQKIGATFPGQRCACYSSDLLMRQFARVKQELGKNFSYRNLQKVYSIILIENSSSEYHRLSEQYLHRAKQIFDTGLELDMLQEYVIIPLDIFKKVRHNELSKLDAWLYFLCSDDPKDISRIVESYSQFKKLYAELLMLRYQLEELIEMYDVYREGFRIADENEIKYYIEELKKEMDDLKHKVEEQKRQVEEQKHQVEEQKRQVEEQKRQVEEQKRQIEEQKRQVEEQKRQVEEQKCENKELRKKLNELMKSTS